MVAVWAHHSRPSLGQAELDSVSSAIRAGFVGCGPANSALLDALRRRTERKHAFAVLSGTQALALALASLDLPPASPVQVPVLGCQNLLDAIGYAGHRATYADIDAGLRMTPDDRGTPRIAVHPYGLPLDQQLLEGNSVVEDAATSPAATSAGRRGRVSILSFGSTKYMTGGGGGAVLTNDDECAARISDLLGHGEYTGWQTRPQHRWPGELGDLNCALVLTQLNQLDQFKRDRRTVAKAYLDALATCSAIAQLPDFPGHTFFRFVVRTTLPADHYMDSLRSLGIDARTSVNPWLDQPGARYPGANAWYDHLLSLPIHPSLVDESHRLANTVRKALDHV